MAIQAVDVKTELKTPERIRARDPLWLEILEFLYDEAGLLDREQLLEWQDLLAEDLIYKMPLRLTRRRADGLGYEDRMGHFDDTYATVAYRIRRLTQSGSAWAEDPASRTRRYVTNVVIHRTDVPDEYLVSSYILLMRNRWNQPNYEFLSGERRDILRQTDKGWKIARRTIYIDQSTLGTHNLAIFL